MYKASIIYNGFWNQEKPPSVVSRLVQAAQKQNIQLIPIPNTQMIARLYKDVSISGKIYDFSLFWDKDTRLAHTMESAGIKLYNSASAVEICDDKSATHLKLAQHGIPMPKTFVAPMTYVSMDTKPSQFFIKTVVKELGFPMVVKQCYGSMGGQVYLAKTKPQLEKLISKMKSNAFICQQYIESSHGTDIRLYVVGGKIAGAMKRYSTDGDFRSNVDLGGKGENYMPTKKQEELAIKACDILGLEFAGVDILTDSSNNPIICEVNASAWLKEIERVTKKDIAAEIISHIKNKQGIV